MSWQDVGLSDGLNQSRIKTYLRCPKQFYYAYVKGIKKAPNLKMVVGTAVHGGVELNYEHKLEKRKPAHLDAVLDATRDLFRKEVKLAEGENGGKVSKVEAGSYQDEAILLGKTHYGMSAPKFQPIIKPELYFTIDIPGAKRSFFGTIDLIASFVDRLTGKSFKRVVADTKTTRRAYTVGRAHLDLQLTSYAYADRVLHGGKEGVPVKVLFDTVVLKGKNSYGDQVHSERNASQFNRFEDTFRQVEKGIDAGIFPPTDNEQTCGWCGYRDICHKGTAFSS